MMFCLMWHISEMEKTKSTYTIFFFFFLLGFSIEVPSQARIECNDNGDGSFYGMRFSEKNTQYEDYHPYYYYSYQFYFHFLFFLFILFSKGEAGLLSQYFSNSLGCSTIQHSKHISGCLRWMNILTGRPHFLHGLRKLISSSIPDIP